MTVQLLLNAILVMAQIQTSISGSSWDFSFDLLGRIPEDWQLRGNSPRPVYQIKADPDGNRYLAAASQDDDVQLGVEIEARVQERPMLSWRWRVRELPRGGDERNSQTFDSAAAVYAAFGSRLFPRILKYVWSTSVPAGASFKHPRSGRMTIIVVQSGEDSRGQWLTESRNLAADFKAAFGSEPPNLIAIGVKTDSDSTRTSAQADYDDIQLNAPLRKIK